MLVRKIKIDIEKDREKWLYKYNTGDVICHYLQFNKLFLKFSYLRNLLIRF